MTEKRGRGRPRFKPEDRRTEQVRALLRPAEAEAVRRAAKNAGLSIVGYLRMRLGFTTM